MLTFLAISISIQWRLSCLSRNTNSINIFPLLWPDHGCAGGPSCVSSRVMAEVFPSFLQRWPSVGNQTIFHGMLPTPQLLVSKMEFHTLFGVSSGQHFRLYICTRRRLVDGKIKITFHCCLVLTRSKELNQGEEKSISLHSKGKPGLPEQQHSVGGVAVLTGGWKY